MLITFFPILTVLLILSIGVINARHQKGFTYLYIFTAVILYYAATFTLTKPLGMYTLILLPLVTILSTGYIYKRKISARY
jgi:lipopolysaccharide export system permease protein